MTTATDMTLTEALVKGREKYPNKIRNLMFGDEGSGEACALGAICAGFGIEPDWTLKDGSYQWRYRNGDYLYNTIRLILDRYQVGTGDIYNVNDATPEDEDPDERVLEYLDGK